MAMKMLMASHSLRAGEELSSSHSTSREEPPVTLVEPTGLVMYMAPRAGAARAKSATREYFIVCL